MSAPADLGGRAPTFDAGLHRGSDPSKIPSRRGRSGRRFQGFAEFWRQRHVMILATALPLLGVAALWWLLPHLARADLALRLGRARDAAVIQAGILLREQQHVAAEAAASLRARDAGQTNVAGRLDAAEIARRLHLLPIDPRAQVWNILVSDRDGAVLANLVPSGRPASVRDRDFFRYFERGDRGVYLGGGLLAGAGEEPAVAVALQDRGGAFDGVLAVLSLRDDMDAVLGAGNGASFFIGLRRANGGWLAGVDPPELSEPALRSHGGAQSAIDRAGHTWMVAAGRVQGWPATVIVAQLDAALGDEVRLPLIWFAGVLSGLSFLLALLLRRPMQPRPGPAPTSAPERVTHELNNLLAVVWAHADQMALAHPDDADVHGAVAAIRQALRKGSTLTGVPGTHHVFAAIYQGDARPLRLLLVDDDATLRHSYEKALRRLGMRVLSAGDARSAERLLGNQPASEPVDALVVDMVLPGDIDGVDLVRRIRRQHAYMPVVFVTGYVSARLSGALVGDELAAFLRKPVDLPVLVAVIEGLVAGRAARLASGPQAAEVSLPD